MATSEEILRVRLLDAKKAEGELRAVRRELERTTGKTKEHASATAASVGVHERSHKVLGGIGNALRYGGGLLGIGAAAYGLKDLTEGGIKAQEQQLLLQQALRQTGQTGSGHLDELKTAIDKTTGAGGFAALEETEGLTNFVRLTKSSSQAVKLNREAIILARGAHESYGTAVMQVSRIQTGQVGRLQRYLGIIQPVKYYEQQLSSEQKKRFPEKVKEAQLLDKEATAREANRRVLERYGGAVSTYNKSTAGSISNANNAFKNLTEQIGEKLLPAETEAAKWMSNLISEVSQGKGVWGPIGKDIETVWKGLEKVWHFLEQHKTLAKVLGYGAIFSGGAAILKKAPGAGLLSKVFKAGGTAGEAGAAGAETSTPGLLPATLGAVAIGAGANYGIKAGVEALSPGYLKQHSLGEAEQALAGRGPGGAAGHGHETAGGTPAKIDVHVQAEIHGRQLAHIIISDAELSRALAESVAKHTQKRKARE